MKGNIKVEFSELAKSVTAKVSITCEETDITDENINIIKDKAKALFDDAMAYSKNKTLNKML